MTILINPYKHSLRGVGNIIERISPIMYEKLLMLHTNIKDIRYKNVMKRNLLQKNQIGEIVIETINRCNSSCSFCPTNMNNDTRDFKLMDNKLFYSIIRQLRDMNYNQNVCLFGNNEPLLDGRIIHFLYYVKSEIQLSKVILSTNGILLTKDIFYAMIDNLDLLIIDNYNDNLKLHKNVKEIYSICLNNDKYKNKVQIWLRKKNEKLTNRAGQSNNRSKIKTLKSPCIYPFHQMYVMSNGKVGLCCNDNLGRFIIGDLKTETIFDVWNKMNYVRLEMIKYGRENLFLCKKCDTLVVV